LLTQSRMALLLGLSAVLLWSTVATAFKIALRYLDVNSLVALSCLVSALVLCAYLLVQGRLGELKDALKARPWMLLLMGLLNPILYYSVLLRSYDLLPAQQAQTINYTWAITLSILAVPLLGQRFSARDALMAVVGYFGVVVIATEGQLSFGAIESLTGLALALLSTLLWAIFWLGNTRLEMPGEVALAAMFLAASPLALMWLVGSGVLVTLSWQALASATYIGLFEMGVTFLLWSQALKRTTQVSKVANLIFLAPLLSLGLIQVFLGEQIHGATLVGFALIVPALVMQQRG
jgi:drug/metabolite transporter (DMT)-like permease